MFKELVCTKCRSQLKKEGKRLYCQKCGLSFEIKEGIPIMWQPQFEKDKKIREKAEKDLAFSKEYVRFLTKGKTDKSFLKQEQEFFERDTGASLAARMVDEKALKTLKPMLPKTLNKLRVLDVGCGGGKEAEWLLKEGVKEVVCFDISLDFLFLAKKRFEKKSLKPSFFVQGNAEHLPFKDQSFDLVFFMGTLHHIPRPYQALAEVARVSRMIALVGEPADMGPIAPILRLLNWNTEYGDLQTTRFSAKKLTHFFSQRGFKTQIKTNFIWFPFPVFSGFKESRLFIKFYFQSLRVLDKLFPSLGHNLTLLAKKSNK